MFSVNRQYIFSVNIESGEDICKEYSTLLIKVKQKSKSKTARSNNKHILTRELIKKYGGILT